jgi:hypothetical protein
MTREQIEAAVALADTLAQENEALAVLDFPRAAGLLEAKQRATEALSAAASRAAGSVQPDAEQLARDVSARLRDLAAENKRLLEHAIGVQGRVIGMLAQAMPKPTSDAGRYGADGAIAGTRQPAPMAISARA